MSAPAIPLRLRQRVHARSGMTCEAYTLHEGVAVRCSAVPVEVHHRLPRSRGGGALDRAGDIYHLIDVCPRHHRELEQNRDAAYTAGLLIAGHAWTDKTGAARYNGPDLSLSERYPAEEES